MSSSTRFKLQAALVNLELGRENRALELAKHLAEQVETEPQSYAGLIEGEAALRRGDFKRAVESFSRANDLVDSWLGRLGLGRAFLEAGRLPEAHSELELCMRRKGEALAVFLDDRPTFHLYPDTLYYLGRIQEALASPSAAESYRASLDIKTQGEVSPLVEDARRRLERID
jgi:tetratricopeptide (TPR) repeat protein